MLEGAVRTVIDGHERRFSAGDTVDVPAGPVHQMAGDDPARVGWQVRPALRPDDFFEDLYSGVAAADPGGFLEQYAVEIQLVAAARYVA